MPTPRCFPSWPSVLSTLRPTHRHVAHFEQVLGTALEVQLLTDHKEQAGRAQAALLAEIDRLEQVFSRFLPDSELNRWLASRGAVPVSPELGTVLQQALSWTALSGGAFHPATEALSTLWRQAEASGEPPDPGEVLAQMQGPPYTVTPQAGRWTATRLTRLPLDFNAFAKGFIADRAAQAAWAVPGVRQVLVNIGGDVRVLGPQPVRVDIADPGTVADNAAPVSVVQVRAQGVATSGRARRGFTVGGHWHSHVLDPRTGQPAEGVISASVVAPDSASADVLATIFSVLEIQASLRLAERLPGVACLLFDQRGQVFRSARWRDLEVSSAAAPTSPSAPTLRPPFPDEVSHDPTHP